MALTASQAYKDAIRASHKIAVKVEIFQGAQRVAVFERTPSTTLVISGEVTTVTDDYISRHGRITIVDKEGLYIPTGQASAVWYGRIMKIYRGVVFTNGSVEYVQIGQLRVNRAKISSNGTTRLMTIGGVDPADGVKRARFTDVYEIAAGTNVATAIQTLLSGAGVTQFNFVSTASVTTKLTFQRADDRWAAAQQIAKGAGLQLFFDVQAYAVLRVPPNPASTPVAWTYDTTVYNAADTSTGFPVLDVDRENTDEGLYNHVIVTGESSTAVVRAEAKDLDPLSPTYINGPFGDVPYFEVVPSTSSQADAQARADALLAEVTRATEAIGIQSIPNPLLEPGDIIYIKDAGAIIDNNYVAANFTIPFERGGTMTIGTIKQKVS